MKKMYLKMLILEIMAKMLLLPFHYNFSTVGFNSKKLNKPYLNSQTELKICNVSDLGIVLSAI